MKKNQLYAWFKEGNITVPSFLLVHYRTLGLNEQELVLLLQLQNFIDKGQPYPAPSQLSERMSLQEEDCAFMIQKLIQKGYIHIEGENNQEYYTLDSLYEKMLDCFLKMQNKIENEETAETASSLYTVFEKEFGRPLSPFECETLAMWMEDDHQPDIVKAALKEAVVSGKLNFRYIDRILFEWKKSGIKTLEQARDHSQKFRAYQRRDKREAPEEPLKDVPFYNWLEQ
ncbi:DnaD domain-containing protein [Bacillus massiliglaciei]|uniref:DnaD domain-containing protein n=1 Tax=Bacillus massiliglaciei TaxID=1816693 RepID=UPI000A67F9FC|nr:DnaD domain-containing protein [Bacillus massiliglaciei]